MPDPLWQQLLLQLILILINAFFASAEIAILSLNENKLRKHAEEGDKKASKLLRLVEKPEGFLSTIQVGITLAGFLGSAFAAENFSDLLANWIQSLNLSLPVSFIKTISLILITLVLSYFTLVLGELVPKRLAMKKSEKIAFIASGVIRALAVVLKPVVFLLSASTNGILKLFGLSPKDEVESVTEEEIRMMVDIGEESGTIEATEKELIENVFEFNNMVASDVMVHRTDMQVLKLDETDENIIQMIKATGLSRFPVYNEDIDDIVGILNARDYLINAADDTPKTIRDLVRDPYLVPETVPTDVLFRDMQKNKVHMAIVLDEYGGTSGLITMEDLLEEIVGNIYDEFDPQVTQDIEKLDENLWRIAGSIDLDTLEEALEIELTEEEHESDTLGGLVYSKLSTIPSDGETPEVETERLHIKVEEILDRRVEKALVSKKLLEDKESEKEE